MKRLLFTLLAACGLLFSTLRAQASGSGDIAEIDGVRYGSLLEVIAAFENAERPKTITLLQDLDCTTAIPAGTWVRLDASGVTFDLGGHTLTTGYSKNNKGIDEPLLVLLGNFTLTNGKVQSNGSYGIFTGNVPESNPSAVPAAIIENVEVLNGGINVGSKVELRDVTVSGGNYYAVWCDASGDATIKSGTYASDGSAVLGVSNNATGMTIENGTFTAKEGKTIVLPGYGAPLIKGGSFNKDMSTENATWDSFQEWTKNESGSWVLQDKPKPTGKIVIKTSFGEEEVYDTLQAAIDGFEKVENAFIIDLLEDWKESVTIRAGQTVPFFFSHKLVNEKGKDTITVEKGGSLEVYGGPVVNESDGRAAFHNAGTIDFDSSVIVTGSYALKNNGGTVRLLGRFDGKIETTKPAEDAEEIKIGNFTIPVGAVKVGPGTLVTDTNENILINQTGDRWCHTAEKGWYKCAAPKASVGEALYANLQDAVDAIEQEGTVTIVYERSSFDECFKIPEGKIITLDLNGKTLRNPSSSKGTPVITNNGTLTITDTAGTAGTIKQYSNSTCELIANTGTLTIEGGKFTPDKTNGVLNGVFANTGTITVTGGAFNQDISTVTGVKLEKAFEAKITTSSGATTYYTSLQAALNDVAKNGTVTVLRDVIFDDLDAVVAAWGEKWGEVEDADKEEAIGELLSELNRRLFVLDRDVAITLDLAGHTISSDMGYIPETILSGDLVPSGTFILKQGSLTLTDSSTEHRGKIEGASMAVFQRGGTLVIKGGTYRPTGGTFWDEPVLAVSALWTDSGTCTIEDGAFYAGAGGACVVAEQIPGVSPPEQMEPSMSVKGGRFEGFPSASVDVSAQVLAPDDEGMLVMYPTFADFAKAHTDTFDYDDTRSILGLKADYSPKNGVFVNGNVTIDLNGHAWTFPKDMQLLCRSGAEVTLQDSIGNGCLAQAEASDQGVIVTYGRLTLLGGTIGTESTATHGIVMAGNAELTIVDGTIYGEFGAIAEASASEGTRTLTILGGRQIVQQSNCPFAPDQSGSGSKVTCVVRGGIYKLRQATDDSQKALQKNLAKYCGEGFVPYPNEDGTYTVDKGTFAVQVGDGEKYATLQEAIAAAKDGEIITLLRDVELTDTVTVDSGVTLDGNGFALSATNSKLVAFNVETECAVIFKNVSLSGVGRAIVLLNTKANVTLTNCTFSVDERGVTCPLDVYDGMALTLDGTVINQAMVTEENKGTYASTSSDARGISLWGVRHSTVTLQNGSELNGFGYAINVSGNQDESGVANTEGLEVLIKDSTIRSWAALNVWGALASYTVDNSTLIGINTSSASSQTFATIVFNDDIYDTFADSHAENNKLILKDATVTNYQAGTCCEDLIRIDCGITKLILEGSLTFKDTTGNVPSVLDLSSMADPLTFLKNSVERKDGCTITSIKKDGSELPLTPMLTVYYWWYSGDKKKGVYCDLKEVFEKADYVLTDGEHIDLIADAVLDHNVLARVKKDGQTGSFTLKLGEYTVSGGGKVILPEGVSVITDAGLELFDSEEGSALVRLPYSEGMYEVGVFVATIPNGAYVMGYATLQEAIAAAKDGETITLLRDVTLEDTVTLTKDIAIDLAGHTLYAKDSETLAFTSENTNGVTVTFSDSSKTEAKNGTGAFVSQKQGEENNGSHVTIEGVPITAVTKWTDEGAFTIDWFKKWLEDEEASPEVVAFTLTNEKEFAGLAWLLTSKDAEKYQDSLKDIANLTITLTADLDLSMLHWVPAGTFSGTLNGQGHTIVGLRTPETLKAGLFEEIAGGATVQALKLSSATLNVKTPNSNKQVAYGGAFAAKLSGGLSQCVAENVTLVANNATGLGGLAGQAVKTATVENCLVAENTISTSKSSGAFVGAPAEGMTVKNSLSLSPINTDVAETAKVVFKNVYDKKGDTFTRHNTVEDPNAPSGKLGAEAQLNGIGWLLNGQPSKNTSVWRVDSNEKCTTLLPFATGTVAKAPEVERYLTQEGNNYYANGHTATVQQSVVDDAVATVLQTMREDYKVNETLTIADTKAVVVYPGAKEGMVEAATLTVGVDIPVCLDTVKSVTLEGTGTATLASESIVAEQFVMVNDGLTLKVAGGVTLEVAGTVTVTSGDFIGTDGTSSVNLSGSVTGLEQGLSAWDVATSKWVQALIKASNGVYYGTVAQVLAAELGVGDTVTLLSRDVANANVFATSAGREFTAEAAYDVADVLGGAFVVTKEDRTPRLVYAYDLGVGGLTIRKAVEGEKGGTDNLVVEVTVKLAEGNAAPSRTLEGCTLTVTSIVDEKEETKKTFTLEGGLTFTEGVCKVVIPYTTEGEEANFPMGTSRLTVSVSKE